MWGTVGMAPEVDVCVWGAAQLGWLLKLMYVCGVQLGWLLAGEGNKVRKKNDKGRGGEKLCAIARAEVAPEVSPEVALSSAFVKVYRKPLSSLVAVWYKTLNKSTKHLHIERFVNSQVGSYTY